jgi:hypothetical protein
MLILTFVSGANEAIAGKFCFSNTIKKDSVETLTLQNNESIVYSATDTLFKMQ